MKLFTRVMVAAGAVSLAATGTAKADAPSLSAFASPTVFTAAATGTLTVTFLFARTEYTNNLVLFSSVGGAAIGTNPLIAIPGNYPAPGAGSPLTASFAVTAGQTLLFGICSSGNEGNANALACPSGYGAYYMGPGTNNVNDASIHAAITTGAIWNAAATASGCLGETPACYLTGATATVFGFEDTHIPNQYAIAGEPDYNDAVFSYEISTAPEPGTMGLLAVGLVGLSGTGLIRRRRSAKRNS